MQNEMMQNADMNGVGFLLGMLWVFALGAAMLVAYIGRRTNERKARTVGFELEVIKTAHQYSNDANHSLANFLTKVKSKGGFEAYFAGYTHEVGSKTKVVTDGSLNSGGVEVVSPPLNGQSERRRWLTDTTKALLGLVRPDRSCGVHLHVGLKKPNEEWGQDGVMTWRDAKKVAAKTAFLYTLFQDAFNSIVPPSRRNNRYAQRDISIVAEVLSNITETNEGWGYWTRAYDNLTERGRYYCVNVNALRRYGTIEFRQHGGSTNPVKLDAWAQLCIALVSRAESLTNAQVLSLPYGRTLDLNDLGHFLGLSPRTNLMRYFGKRVKHLAGVPTEPCGECRSDKCAGCQASAHNDWDTVYQEPPVFRYDYYSEAYDDGYDMCCASCGGEELTSLTIRPESNEPSRGYCEDCEWTCDLDFQINLAGLGLLVFALTQPLAVAALVLIGCGIGALHSRGKQYDNNKVAKELWVNLSDRGRQAAGIGWVDSDSLRKDGTHHSFFYHKAPHSSTEQVGALKRLLSKTVRYVTFHTRFATHGANNADNAHPHFSSCNRVMLVHNGVVGNSDGVWRALGRDPTGPVDSQAVAECLAVGGIQEVIKHCVGTMSLIWADSRDPAGTLHFWTNGGNPLHFGRLDNPTGDIMVASTAAIWEASAGDRAITETVRTVKTERVKIGKGYSARYQVRDVVDKRGRKVMQDVQQTTHNWAAVVGKHYTISPEGEINGVMTENHEDTVRTGGSYDWRSYGTAYDSPRKATGNADNCSIDADDKVVTQDDMDAVYDYMDKHGSWPPFKGAMGDMLHGYDQRRHMGIRPNGERYELDMAMCDPWVYEHDRRELLAGLYDDADHGLTTLWGDDFDWRDW